MAGMAGCFYPPTTQAPPPSDYRVVVGAPYDLAWSAVHKVIKRNGYTIQGEAPNHGIVEAQAQGFTLKDANCGEARSIGSKFKAEPTAGATAVYNFTLHPIGAGRTSVAVEATFSTPINVPLHEPRNFQCVSTGRMEEALLKQIRTVAMSERRPVLESPATLTGPKEPAPLLPGRATLMRPHLDTPQLVEPQPK